LKFGKINILSDCWPNELASEIFSARICFTYEPLLLKFSFKFETTPQQTKLTSLFNQFMVFMHQHDRFKWQKTAQFKIFPCWNQ